MRLFFEKRVVVAFVLACIIPVVLGILIFINSSGNFQSDKAFFYADAHAIVLESEQILSDAIDLEAGQMSYIITREPSFLESYKSSADAVNAHMHTLKKIVEADSSQAEQVKELSMLIDRKLKFTAQSMAALSSDFSEEEARLATINGKAMRDTIRSQIGKIQAEAYSLLKEKTQVNRAKARNLRYAVMTLTASVLLLIIFIFFTLNRRLKRHSTADHKLRKYSEEMKDLYDHAPCGYHSIDSDGYFLNMNQTELNWLGYTRNEVIRKLKFSDIIAPGSFPTFVENFEKLKATGSTTNLEFEFLRKDKSTFFGVLSASAIYDAEGKFLRSRSTLFDQTENVLKTRRINELNQEMESLTYSVSHDLRAPLRSIAGYSKIIREDYGDSLKDEGLQVLDVVIRNANRMEQLINDLLSFSRVGRRELAPIRMAMEKNVRNIVKDMTDKEMERKIHVNVNPLHDAAGDPVMIRQVWENLISNAIKYTRKSENPTIEIGSRKEKEDIVFYIKDNGVGFDMAYAHKLFGVFQRLHKLNDFEGTGVGLAVVKQIVTRHGGKVWVKSRPGKGAAFYFTLPTNVKPKLAVV